MDPIVPRSVPAAHVQQGQRVCVSGSRYSACVAPANHPPHPPFGPPSTTLPTDRSAHLGAAGYAPRTSHRIRFCTCRAHPEVTERMRKFGASFLRHFYRCNVLCCPLSIAFQVALHSPNAGRPRIILPPAVVWTRVYMLPPVECIQRPACTHMPMRVYPVVGGHMFPRPHALAAYHHVIHPVSSTYLPPSFYSIAFFPGSLARASPAQITLNCTSAGQGAVRIRSRAQSPLSYSWILVCARVHSVRSIGPHRKCSSHCQ